MHPKLWTVNELSHESFPIQSTVPIVHPAAASCKKYFLASKSDRRTQQAIQPGAVSITLRLVINEFIDQRSVTERRLILIIFKWKKLAVNCRRSSAAQVNEKLIANWVDAGVDEEWKINKDDRVRLKMTFIVFTAEVNKHFYSPFSSERQNFRKPLIKIMHTLGEFD